jgi:tRNA pseudouridine38-40 synthase
LRYFVQIGYKGFNYRGWQRQPDVETIQEVMETNLSRVLHNYTVCIGCGRTDARVHASQFFFHFDFNGELHAETKFRLNKILPNDISVFDIIPVQDNTHAQFSAISRTYDYLIHTQKDPFINELSALYPLDFNIDLMSQAAKLIPQYSDFLNFCLTPKNYSTTICKISSAKILTHSNGKMIRFQITSNRFLRGMVRLLVQKLIDVGTGNLSLSDFESYLALKTTPKEMRPAYPQGLYLSAVKYSFPILDSNKSNLPFNYLLNNLEWSVQ